jgi:hypothetical protein
MEMEKTVSEIDDRVAEEQQQKAAREQELREVDGGELEICACAEVINIGNAVKKTEVQSNEHDRKKRGY